MFNHEQLATSEQSYNCWYLISFVAFWYSISGSMTSSIVVNIISIANERQAIIKTIFWSPFKLQNHIFTWIQIFFCFLKCLTKYKWILPFLTIFHFFYPFYYKLFILFLYSSLMCKLFSYNKWIFKTNTLYVMLCDKWKFHKHLFEKNTQFNICVSPYK